MKPEKEKIQKLGELTKEQSSGEIK